DDVRGEDREATATADVLVLAQRRVEVHRLVEGKLVDEDQVVAWPPAAHAEAGELARRCQPGQTIERQQRIGTTADGVAQRVPVEPGAGRRCEGIDRSCLHHHFLQQRDGQFELDPGVLPGHYAD